MKWQYIFNPFLKYTEKQLLIVSILGLAGFGFLGFLFDHALISIFKIGEIPDLSLINSFIYSGLSYLSAIILLLILGKIFNQKTRIIDIVNCVGISQLPLLLVLIMSNIPILKNLGKNINHSAENTAKLNLQFVDIAALMILLSITLPILIYSIILIYNGFKTATNIKSWQKISIFTIVLLFFLLLYQLSILNLNL